MEQDQCRINMMINQTPLSKKISRMLYIMSCQKKTFKWFSLRFPKKGKKIHLLKKAESLKRALYALDAASATTLHLKYIYTSHTLKKKTKKMRHSIKKELLGALFECSSSSGSSSTGQQSLYIKPPSYVRVCVCRPSL